MINKGESILSPFYYLMISAKHGRFWFQKQLVFVGGVEEGHLSFAAELLLALREIGYKGSIKQTQSKSGDWP